MSEFEYEKLVIDIPDYPEPGVVFKDITPILSDPDGLKATIEALANHFKGSGATKVMGAEARGFIVGVPVAYCLGIGFVPARKPGKLPREVYAQEYALEYGTDIVEIHKDALTTDDKVLIIDDLIATGGTALANAQLVERAGAELVGFGFLMELEFLHGREFLAEHYNQDLFSLIKVS